MSVTISASEVNKLRQETGAGIMDCKKALIESNGDFEAAIDYLRKKGAKIAANRSDREANEGVIIAVTTEDGKFGCAVNLSSETDFVAKNEDFINLTKSIANVALAGRIKTLDELNEAQLEGISIKDKLLDTVAKIGEKIEVKKYEVVEGEGVVAYIHMGYKMGVLVQLNKPLTDAITAAGKDVAMQIAAMNPLAVDGSGVSDDAKNREKEIAMDKGRAAGKPDNILEKIAEGAVNTFVKENTLLPQAFVKDGSKTVEQYLHSVDKDLTVVSFKRITLS